MKSNIRINSCFFLIGLVLFSFLISCNDKYQKNRIKKEVKSLIGKTINLNIEVNEAFSDTIIKNAVIPDDCYRIVSFIPIKSCTKCMLKIIPVMDSIRFQMNKTESTKLIIITDQTDDELKKVLSELNITSSVYFDVNNEYLGKNKMTNILDRNKTVLVDKQGKIILVGEPFYNNRMRELYLNAVLK